MTGRRKARRPSPPPLRYRLYRNLCHLLADALALLAVVAAVRWVAGG